MVRVMFLGLVAFLAVGFPSDSRTGGASPCSASSFSIRSSGPISEPTGQHTLSFALRNNGRAGCSLYGYPTVAFYDRAGKIPFGIWHGGDQVVTARKPRRFVVQPGRAAFIALNKYRCDLGPVR